MSFLVCEANTHNDDIPAELLQRTLAWSWVPRTSRLPTDLSETTSQIEHAYISNRPSPPEGREVEPDPSLALRTAPATGGNFAWCSAGWQTIFLTADSRCHGSATDRGWASRGQLRRLQHPSVAAPTVTRDPRFSTVPRRSTQALTYKYFLSLHCLGSRHVGPG